MHAAPNRSTAALPDAPHGCLTSDAGPSPLPLHSWNPLQCMGTEANRNVTCDPRQGIMPCMQARALPPAVLQCNPEGPLLPPFRGPRGACGMPQRQHSAAWQSRPRDGRRHAARLLLCLFAVLYCCRADTSCQTRLPCAATAAGLRPGRRMDQPGVGLWQVCWRPRRSGLLGRGHGAPKQVSAAGERGAGAGLRLV